MKLLITYGFRIPTHNPQMTTNPPGLSVRRGYEATTQRQITAQSQMALDWGTMTPLRDRWQQTNTCDGKKEKKNITPPGTLPTSPTIAYGVITAYGYNI